MTSPLLPVRRPRPKRPEADGFTTFSLTEDDRERLWHWQELLGLTQPEVITFVLDAWESDRAELHRLRTKVEAAKQALT